jgi:UDP-N-acetylmuramate--alanine ligase
MSALARYFQDMGKEIYGYDLTPTPLTKQLELEGMHIHYREDIEQIPKETDLVIYTPAIPADHKELLYLQKQDLPILKRSEVIGMLSREYYTVAVAGTHGKTSICAVTAHLLKTAGVKVTAFVGGIMKNYGSNLITSNPTEVLLVEADEFDRSFLRISPDVAVVSSMDADHLDIYGDLKEMEKNYLDFIDKLGSKGLLIYHDRLTNLGPLNQRKLAYGLHGTSDIRAEHIHVASGRFHFDLVADKYLIEDIAMSIPGRHYIENALAAASIAFELGASAETVKEGLESFQGVERRFELVMKQDNRVYIDDYAHHPKEIEVTLAAVKELFPGAKITTVFQPHLFSRTRDHEEGFAAVLDDSDEIILLDIYPAREKPIPGISSENILQRMKNQKKKILSRSELLGYLKEAEIEVLLTLGAGDIGLLTNDIATILRGK